MKYPPYPKSKSSGVEWLGDIPAHWSVERIGRLVTKVGSGVTPKGGADAYQPQGITFLRSQNVYEEGLRLGDVVFIDRDTDAEMAATRVHASDLLLNITGASLGRCTLVPPELGPANVNQHVCIIRFGSSKAEPAFIHRAFTSALIQAQIRSFENGSSREGLNFQQVKSLVVAVPPQAEQRTIADVLAEATSRFNTLVSKKQALIEKLKEKRAALISRTVTRGLPPDAARAAGLDPDPALKPSGVEWLGDVPTRWDGTLVKHIARVGNGSTPNRENADYWWDGSHAWLNSAVANLDEVTTAVEYVTDSALKECHLPVIKPPAVLMGITGQGKTRGMATILRIKATINQHLAYVKPFENRCEVEYLRRLFDHAYQFLRNESDGAGSTKGAITCEQIVNLRICLPPIAEQRAIAAYLDRETTKIDRMVAKVEEAIARLREYRAALITAAVTGKIDVRGHAPGEAVGVSVAAELAVPAAASCPSR